MLLTKRVGSKWYGSEDPEGAKEVERETALRHLLYSDFRDDEDLL